MCPPLGFEGGGVARSETPRGERPKALRVWLLGGFRVSVGSRTIKEGTWRLRKAASLVKLLALAPDHRLHREQAMDLLWPDLGRTAAFNNLRQALHTARRAMGPDPLAGSRYLASEEESLVLSPEGELWVDAEAFEEAASNAHRSREPAAYEAALYLYAGELLPGDRYEEWAEEHRRRLRETYFSLLLRLARVYEKRGDHDSATEVLRRVVMEEPIREEAHIGLMRLHALSGSKGESLAQYERLEEVLLKELGTEPAASSRALKDEIASGRFPPRQEYSSHSPPEETPSVSRHNLPAARSSFVGREREMMEVKRELAMTRLLTLTGMGGSGKTRLALEVARSLVGAYPDGVWLVELADLSEAKLLPEAVAGALEAKEHPGQPLTDTLAEILQSKRTLLVLDNCEHLVEAAADLVDLLLGACPHVRVLVTSREPLDIPGEVRWTVPSLSVPDARHSSTVVELEDSESVRLFAERARQRNPAFALGPGNAEAVVDICRRLEGVPLAIELAAARVGTLSVEQISQKLEDSLKLLTGGGRTAVPRQRTLRGALDWSHELLSEREKKLFGRLAAFTGGWTLEATETVASGEGIEESDILELLSGLVGKSLVVAEDANASTVRYRLLEPVRQYALERLDEHRKVEELRRRHAEFFVALAEAAEPKLWGSEEKVWLDRLEDELDNIRAALAWTIENREAELGLRLAGALYRFWWAQGYYREGRGWLERALAVEGRVSVWARAKALDALGWLAHGQGDIDQMVTAAEEGLKLSKGAEIEGGMTAPFLDMLGAKAETSGDYERAAELFEESLKFSRQASDTRQLAYSLLNLAHISNLRGDHERAAKLYEEGIVLCRESGHAVLLAEILGTMSYDCLLQGDYKRAVALSEEAVALFRDQGHRGSLEGVLDTLGWAALWLGDHERSKALYEESLALSQELDDKLVASESLEGLACVAGAKGEAERAARLFGTAEALREAVGYQQEPREFTLREPYLLAARSRLYEASWQAAWAEGKIMTLQEAVEYALAAEEAATSPASAATEQSSGREPRAALTRREREVAGLVVQGLTNRQVASELFISERTVDHHVERILKKLELRSREHIASRLSKH